MDQKEIELLENDGWIIECHNPKEIYHEETNSKATGIAVDIVIEHLINSVDQFGGKH